jgi:Cu/Ag efflux pump CusA
MAVTVIGGLLVSTLLTLVVIPAAVIVFDRRRPRPETEEQ